MNEITKGGSGFVGYEYKEVSAPNDKASMYLDGYESFGWVIDENLSHAKIGSQVLIKLKRDHKILNKVELTRLQQHFEACLEEINTLEKSKTSLASMVSISIGLLGTTFMALSTFAITHEPPLILLCVLFAIPGFIGWGLPYFVCKIIIRHTSKKATALIEQKYDEIYEVCEKGNNLLSK